MRKGENSLAFHAGRVSTWNSVFPARGKYCYLPRFPLVLLLVQRGCF